MSAHSSLQFRRFVLVLAFIPLVIWIGGGRHAFAASTPADDRKTSSPAGFIPTTTHIEADPWRVFKVEKPEPMGPRNRDVSTFGDNQAATINLNWNGLIDLQKHLDPQGRDRSLNIGFLRIPFFRSFHVNRDGALIWKNNQIMNWYLFALMDGVVEKNYDKKNALGDHRTYMRLAFLDAPLIFTGYKYKLETPQSTYWEALDLPLSNTISHKTDKDKNEWRVLNVPLFWAWRYDRDGTVTTTNFLSSVVDGYTRQQKPDDDEWRVLDAALLGTLAHGRQFNHGEERLTLLEGNTVHDGSLYFLWRRTTENDVHGTFKFHSSQYLKLPFIGPLYASWTAPDGSHCVIFPKIFLWKQAPQSIQTVF